MTIMQQLYGELTRLIWELLFVTNVFHMIITAPNCSRIIIIISSRSILTPAPKILFD